MWFGWSSEQERFSATFELTSIDGIHLDAAVHHTPVDPARGVVLLVHGITVDMDEGGGMFVRLADRLVASGFNVVRFSFRGHGASGGTPEGMTIAGECLDLQAAMAAVDERFPGQQLSIVAASFGAVSVALSLSWLDGLHRLVLWNPVLDLSLTFLTPELAWGRENFGPDQQKVLQDSGFLLVDAPVSYDIASEFARSRPDTALHTVVGSDHRFDSREREDEAIEVTVEWLSEGSSVMSKQREANRTKNRGLRREQQDQEVCSPRVRG
ncbi:alpha/beta hydrolase [Nocardia sp. NPDC050175]|uniref:alpha/beta hydrolase n=1 Tax=Nocardia sp. NPDC050175 TaxID=3364317 RepID=UPI0037B1CC6D